MVLGCLLASSVCFLLKLMATRPGMELPTMSELRKCLSGWPIVKLVGKSIYAYSFALIDTGTQMYFQTKA